jgi:hypothetical protein
MTGKPEVESQLAITGVAAEKLVFCTNSLNYGDRKCLPGRNKSFVGHPGAMNFPRAFRG